METTETGAQAHSEGAHDSGYPEGQVRRLHLGAREFIVVGTAHVSRESAELVRSVIERERPDCVCVELDAQRYDALTNKTAWESLDIKAVIRRKQLSTLLVNILLSAYQKRLGLKLGVTPGTELLEATKVSEELSIPLSLCDRDVRVTLRRAWRSTPLFKKTLLLSAILGSLFEKKEIDEQELQNLMKKDVLSELMRELGEAMPDLKRVLIDERDIFLSQKMRESHGDKVVAVVGAGHLEGIVAALESETEHDLQPINEIPPLSPVWKWIGWGVPAGIIAAVGYIGYAKGLEAASDNVVFWILANGIPCAIGAMLALAHPATIFAAFIAAPITSLTPVIGAAYVTAFVQAFYRPPVVREFQSVGEDAMVAKRWWKNRLLKVFLAFVLPGFGSFLGSVVGGVEIFSNLFD